jgi:hypothetical protein
MYLSVWSAPVIIEELSEGFPGSVSEENAGSADLRDLTVNKTNRNKTRDTFISLDH